LCHSFLRNHANRRAFNDLDMKWFLISCVLLLASNTFAQITIEKTSSDTSDFFDEHPISPLIGFLVPAGIRDGYRLREYLASDAYRASCAGETQAEQMDNIYYEAVALAHGNRSRAVLATAISVFEHGSIQLRMPGFILPIPLTSESRAHFEDRVRNLPHYIYSEKINDVDKLQHFFSSAWLKRALGMDWLVSLAGDLVEIGEEAMVVGGSNDPRDKHANHDGIRFAHQLDSRGCQDELLVSPSKSLTPNP
jgi:hypothetical protein